MGHARAVSSIPAVRWTAFALVALGALALRLPQLGARPMHTDEAVNAYIVGNELGGRAFVYDPVDRHGPALTALALPLVRLEGARDFAGLTEAGLRLAPVLAGVATILLLAVSAELFGFAPCLLAALLMATAPLSVYYDRYFIHEPLFVAATLAWLTACGLLWRRPGVWLAAWAGLSGALMLAAKETAALHFAVLGVVAVFLYLARRRRMKWDPWLWPAVVAATVFVLVGVALFSWFGANWQALSVLPVAARDVFARASGEGHQKSVWYYAQLLSGGWSGWLVAGFASAGLLRAGTGRAGASWLALAGYGVAVTVLYSLIPYKTPWLALNLWLPEALLAGLGAVELFRIVGPRMSAHVPLVLACLTTVLAVVLLAHDTRQRVFSDPAGESNPYAYAQTSEDLLGLPAEVGRLARQQGLSTPRIAVITADPWPLPWYFRHYTQVGYWQPGQAVGPADFYITSTEVSEQYSAQLNSRRPDFFGARPGVLVLLWPPVSQ